MGDVHILRPKHYTKHELAVIYGRLIAMYQILASGENVVENSSSTRTEQYKSLIEQRKRLGALCAQNGFNYQQVINYYDFALKSVGGR